MKQAGTIAVLRQSMARIEAGLAPTAAVTTGALAREGAVPAESFSTVPAASVVSAVTDVAVTDAAVIGAATDGIATAGAAVPARQCLPVPSGLERLFPNGLAAAAVHTCPAAGTVVAGIIAEATRAGKHVAVVGLPDFGLLSITEQGGDLSRIVCVDEPGANPLETIGLLIDGVELVVAHLPQAPAPSLARPIVSRLRKTQGTLLFVGENWPGARTRITSELVSVAGVGRGQGRIRGVRYRVNAVAKGQPERSVLWTVGDCVESSFATVLDSGSKPDSSVVSLEGRREAKSRGEMNLDSAGCAR